MVGTLTTARSPYPGHPVLLTSNQSCHGCTEYMVANVGEIPGPIYAIDFLKKQCVLVSGLNQALNIE